MVDEGTRKTLQCIPLLQTRASPRDKELWVQRLKEEYQALIKVTYYYNLYVFQCILHSGLLLNYKPFLIYFIYVNILVCTTKQNIRLRLVQIRVE